MDEVGIFNKLLIIIRLYDGCGRSNERPYLSVVRVFDNCAVGVHCCVGTETANLIAKQNNYTLKVGTYRGASASEETLRYIIFIQHTTVRPYGPKCDLIYIHLSPLWPRPAFAILIVRHSVK